MRAEPGKTAILTDFDGTLAPIVERAAEAAVPAAAREALAALSERAEGADDDDRGEARAGGEALAEGEPEDQQRHDDGAAADPEKAAESARGGADRGQSQQVAAACRV